MSRMTRAAILFAAASMAALAIAGTASATTLQGPWAPFDRCPVDDPAMLAAPDRGNACVASDSPHGTFQIGPSTVTTGKTNLQLGVFGPGVPNVAAGSLVADPAKVPGGLLGLMCPSGIPLVTALCEQLADNGLNRVTATVELAGTPRDFDLFAPVQGGPIVTLPVKIHLENPLLGRNCFIGSDETPIVLRPRQEPHSTGISFTDDPLGSSALFIDPTGPEPVSQIDDSFAVPRAEHCSILTLAVNLKQGLPSPAGKNRLVLEEATSNLVGNATNGQALSDAWHAAVVQP